MQKNSRILRFLWPYQRQIILAALLMLIEVGLNAWQPKIMSTIVDDGVLNMNTDVIVHGSICMLIVAFFGGVGGYLSCVLSNTYAQRFGNSLRKALFAIVMRLPELQIHGYSEGTLLNRITADTRVLTEFSAVLIQSLVKPVLLFLFGSIMIFSINPAYGWIVLAGVPVQLLIMYYFIHKTSPIFRTVQEKLDRVSTLALQLVANNRLIKAYVREEYEAERFGDANRSLMETTLYVQKLMAILNPLIMFLLNGVMLLILYIGGLQAQGRQAHAGQIMAAISYSQQIMMSLMMAGAIFQHIARSRASAERINTLLALQIDEPERNQVPNKQENTICLENVGFIFPGVESRIPILYNINLQFLPGTKTVIVGATGAGKSTLVNLLAGLYEPTEGSIRLGGVNMRDCNPGEVRRRISVVFQHSDFFTGTVQDNMCYGCKEDPTEEELHKAAQTAQAEKFILGLPRGYKTMVSEQGLSLSGGQRQRIAIARALLRKPDVLVMDDSTSNLDAETEQALYAALKTVQIPVIIIVSQRITNLLDADQIVLLHEGHVEAVGTHVDLMQKSERYRMIYASQCTGRGENNA